MSFLDRIADRLGFERKMSSRELDALLRGGSDARSGVAVNWKTALDVTTVLACCRVIAEGVSQVPWKLYAEGNSEAADHPLYDLLYSQPNPWQTTFEFRETLIFHAVLTGNAFVHKLKVGSARRIASLELFEPGQIAVNREPDGTIRYLYQGPNGERVEIPAADMWHIRGPSWNTWMGLEAVKLAREAIGLSMATEAAHADLHRNGTRATGMYSVQGTLTSEKFEQISKWMDRHAQDGDRAGKPLILDNAAKFEKLAMSGVDAQHLETRKHQVEEICRAMRVMPIMVGQADKAATYASAEQMFLAHVIHTLMPWYVRLEKSADVNLLTREERGQGYHTKFNPNALMRGAAQDRAEFYAKALGAGGTPAWMTQDEVRRREELDPMGGAAAVLNQGAMGAQDANAGA